MFLRKQSVREQTGLFKEPAKSLIRLCLNLQTNDIHLNSLEPLTRALRATNTQTRARAFSGPASGASEWSRVHILAESLDAICLMLRWQGESGLLNCDEFYLHIRF